MDFKTRLQSIYPSVKEWRPRPGRFCSTGFEFPLETVRRFRFLFDHFGIPVTGSGIPVRFEECSRLADEEYRIEIDPDRILLSYATPRGCFYALSTFLQIVSRIDDGADHPCFAIYDRPDLRFRGFHLDISRGAVPRLETLRRMMIQVGLLKFNHVGLYIEDTLLLEAPEGGLQKKSLLLPEEIRELNRLARSMGIELFPSVQTLCHMRNWLLQPGRRGLASPRSDDCVDPSRAEAVDQVLRHAQAIADHFPGKLLHIGMDECAALDSPEAYFAHFQKSVAYFQAKGKRVGVWGDMFVHYPDLIRKIPADVLIFNWEYFIEKGEAFEKQAAPFRKHHLTQVLCPATWSWAKLVPAPQRAYRNINASVETARKLNLEGVMLTSWGDDGNEYLLEGIDLCLFHTGNLLWSGNQPQPEAFHSWKGCRDGEDLFRVFTFLANVDQPLPFTHRYYLWEDPLFAPYSGQRQPEEIVAHFRKARDYLVKRIGKGGAPEGYFSFVRDLFVLIAAKVDFSRQLPTMAEQDRWDWIEPNARKLIELAEAVKRSYGRLWLQQYKPEGLFYNQMKFTQIQERLRFLLELKGNTPAWRTVQAKLAAEWNEQPLQTVHFGKLFDQ